jgi:hypothetical protein
MKKSLWFVLIAAFAALLIFAGCPTEGSTESEPDKVPETPPEQSAVVAFGRSHGACFRCY